MKKYIILFGVLLFFSCFIDENDIEKTSDVQLLRSVSLNGEVLYNFEYFPDSKIKAQVTLNGGAISAFTSFEYKNDTVYKKTSGFYTSNQKSYLISSNTLKILDYDNDDNLLFYYLNTYSTGCGLTKTEIYTQYSQLYTITEYDYFDSNCSYNSTRELFNGEVKNNYAITKDDKNNYRTSLNAWPNFEKKHNIIEYRQWDENDNLLLANSYNSTYVYDSNNYPIKETRVSLSGETKVFTYDYY